MTSTKTTATTPTTAPTATSATTIRPLTQIISAHRQKEGGGFIVRRPFPTYGMSYIDPFLLIDEMGPAHYGPGEAIGAPDHPHRGFETVTYMLEGVFQHEDSAGHKGRLEPGDIQWMTAGAGIVHSEMPSQEIQENGGSIHGFQIWVNLPAKDKMKPPKYQERKAKDIPVAKTEDGLAVGKIIAGEALGVKAAITTHIPITFQDWTLHLGGKLTLPIPEEENAMVYVFGGALKIGEEGQVVRDGQLAQLGKGEALKIVQVGDEAARALILAGTPLNEPVARYGPFVMNKEEELQQAFLDYQTGKMGEITRTATQA